LLLNVFVVALHHSLRKLTMNSKVLLWQHRFAHHQEWKGSLLESNLMMLTWTLQDGKGARRVIECCNKHEKILFKILEEVFLFIVWNSEIGNVYPFDYVSFQSRMFRISWCNGYDSVSLKRDPHLLYMYGLLLYSCGRRHLCYYSLDHLLWHGKVVEQFLLQTNVPTYIQITTFILNIICWSMM